MIVFCVGMIRSGSTLQYQIVSELIEKCGFGRSIGWVPPEKIDTIIDASYDDSNFIVVKSHDVTNKMLSLSKEKVKFFYIYRDIRDVTVSAMRQFNWSFEESIDHLSWSLDIHNKIEKCSDHDIYISKYEEVFNNLRSEVRSISQYLGVNASEDIIESITNNLSIESQKEKVKKFKSKHDSLIENPDNEGDFVDTKTQLHINHINKGKINGFLDILTKEQVLFLNLKFYTWLYIHEYQIDDHDLKPLFEDAIKKYIITSNSNLELRNKVQELLQNRQKLENRVEQKNQEISTLISQNNCHEINKELEENKRLIRDLQNDKIILNEEIEKGKRMNLKLLNDKIVLLEKLEECKNKNNELEISISGIERELMVYDLNWKEIQR